MWVFALLLIACDVIWYCYKQLINERLKIEGTEPLEIMRARVSDRLRVQAQPLIDRARNRGKSENVARLAEAMFLSGGLAEMEYQENIIAGIDAEIATLKQQLAEELKS